MSYKCYIRRKLNVTYKENFRTSKIIYFLNFFVSFLFFNIADLLQTKLWEILQKKVGKIWPKSSKTPAKDKTTVKLQAWNFTSKTSLYGWSQNKWMLLNSNIFFSIWDFFHEHSWITGLQEKREGISLTPNYHFHPLHRHLHISRAITAESSAKMFK